MATHRLLQREVLHRLLLYSVRRTVRLRSVSVREVKSRHFSNVNTETLTDSAVEITNYSATEISDVASLSTTAQDILQPVQEIPFTELGLGGYTPVGLLQSCFEFLHMSAGLPWWATIITATVIARCVMFPIIVKNQRASIRLSNVMPTFQKLTKKMNEARQSGNQFEMTKRNMELQRFVKKHDVNPLKTLVGVLVQAPVFISFFIGLRGMAQLPVESMTVGGLSWFTDLTTADPYYALPVLASLSMFAVIQLGAEAGVSSAQAEKIKTVLKIMPFAILPLIASLPKAVFIYWLTSNIFSLSQVALLRIPSIRQALDIPEKVKHDPSDLPKSEGFFKGLKSGWENAKVQHEVDTRVKSQTEALRQAGTGPVPQTFAQDPTRPQPTAAKSTSASSKPVRRKVR
ncbi:putative mitochondrial inner membrane protein OXA1L [Apostichopus japonicus]|uniref:Putative mitochondrial inner membrane protein OXA1L n=1 Tax=Stichopus japonicus TaxID=307972 RepID=A0A2G8LRW6_STIJA|nr:putative mitochondrial inner membrane protein OXA1L [Apostichopus japonicus]